MPLRMCSKPSATNPHAAWYQGRVEMDLPGAAGDHHRPPVLAERQVADGELEIILQLGSDPGADGESAMPEMRSHR